MASFFTKLSLVSMAVALLFVGTTTKAQTIPSCASKVAVCGQYLNSTTTPSDTCCNSIKEVVTNELSCLCSLYNNPDLLKSLGVNVTQAVQLSMRCNVNTDLSACSKAEAPTGSAQPTTGNDGSRMAWTGFSSLLFLLASLSLY